VQTRREAVILMTAIPLLSTDAAAQPDRLDALFNRPAENLSVPSRVRQRYAILAYYIQLLNLQGPMRSREDIVAAIKTYQLVGESIARSDAKFEGTSNNTSFGRFLPWLSGRLQRSCQGGSSIGTALTPDGRPSVLLHDATRTPPVSALRPAQPSAARAEPAGECCNRGSSSRS